MTVDPAAAALQAILDIRVFAEDGLETRAALIEGAQLRAREGLAAWARRAAAAPNSEGEYHRDPVEELRMAATMIRTWIPVVYPANQRGQVPFVRAMMESVAESIEELLPMLTGPTAVVSAEISAERRRQIEVKGYTAEHDDRFPDGQLSVAAKCYCSFGYGPGKPPPVWPFASEAWKPADSARRLPDDASPNARRRAWYADRRRDLVRAAALIVADIEREDRRAAADVEP